MANSPSDSPQYSSSSEPHALRDARGSDQAEALLVEQIKAGEESAFAASYDRLAPTVFSLIFAILHDQKESEDVLQETFVELWRRTASYDPTRSSLFTWVVMIARHKAIDRLRSRQEQSRLADAITSEAERNLLRRTTNRADPAPGERDDRERVRTGFTQLSDAQRTAIDLAFFSGLTQAQLTERSGMPPGAMKAHIGRGLFSLREVLKMSAT